MGFHEKLLFFTETGTKKFVVVESAMNNTQTQVFVISVVLPMYSSLFILFLNFILLLYVLY